MQHWQVFEDCRAALYYGVAWFSGSEVKLVDCHFLRCHAEAKYCGGCSSANGADVEMIRGSIMGCSAGGSGGVNMYGMSTLSLLNVTIAECRATDPDKGNAGGIGVWRASVLTMSGGTIRDCEAPDRGGGLVIDSTSQAHLHGVAIAECRATTNKGKGGGIVVGDDSVLTMSGGAIRDCEATYRGGGLWVGDTAQAHLHGVAVQRCKASIKAGGMDLGGNVSLVDVSIEDCYANERAAMQVVGSLRAERVRVARARGNLPTYLFGTSTWTDSTFVDCSAGPDIMLGAHSFTRLNVRGATNYGLKAYIGVAVVIDSHIADGHGTCVAAEKGALILRNVTLSNCSAPEKPYVSLPSAEEAAAFQAELLTLEPACEAERSGALISVGDAAVTAPLNVRGLRVVAPAACASADLTIFSDHVRPRNCSDAEDVCGIAATCTEVQPLPSAAPNVTTVDCACTGDPNPSGTSGALAPYGFDPSSLGLPDGIDVSDIGLPGSIIDYCVCCSTR